jgi:hypothetical protein
MARGHARVDSQDGLKMFHGFFLQFGPIGLFGLGMSKCESKGEG